MNENADSFCVVVALVDDLGLDLGPSLLPPSLFLLPPPRVPDDNILIITLLSMVV